LIKYFNDLAIYFGGDGVRRTIIHQRSHLSARACKTAVFSTIISVDARQRLFPSAQSRAIFGD
jgi:hypothetical protein